VARSVIKEVEQEYGEPFWDVVAAYAADGNSMTMTARILGYVDGSTLWYLLRHHKKDIQFPKMGYCNAVQNPDPMTTADKQRISDVKRSQNRSAAGEYERETGESAETAIRRLAPNNTVVDTARAIGWSAASSMRAWMKIRGIEVEFKKYNPIPPRTKAGWAELNLGGRKPQQPKPSAVQNIL
jgi:transposase-like protein